MAPRRLLLWFFFWFGLTSQAAMMGVEAAMPWNKQRRRTTTQTRAAATPSSSAADDNTPGVPFLIERLGKEIYAALDRPKYKFYIYMTIGQLPNEANTIVMLNIICNLLYSLGILIGFVYLPRTYMLIGTLATLFIGPALVLLLLGSLALILIAFSVYPITSVLSMWTFFFLTSKVAQVLGRHLGLDQDKDGDCDMLDILHYAASTKWGMQLGLPKLYKMLHESTMDPFQAIHRRLDEIQDSTRSLDESLNSPKKRE